MIRVMSDLHLEFAPFVVKPLSTDNASTLVLAGDIALIESPSTYTEFFPLVSEQFRDVVYVFGNHEFYSGGSLTRAYDKFREYLIRESICNVHLLQNSSIVIDDVAFIGGTMWTDLDRSNPVTIYAAQYYLNDYRTIRRGNRGDNQYAYKISPTDIMKEHAITKQFFEQEIVRFKENGKKVVVVSHHAPSHQSIHKKYAGDQLNGAYCSDLDNIIIDTQPDVWIHGHMHDSFNYYIDNTMIVCNPRGYCQYKNENPYFQEYLTLEI